ncbi:MAG: ATP-binding protein [Betaproteobacteria bacterium]
MTNRDDELVLEVYNGGEPIPTDSLDKIFAPFWRSSTLSTRAGLGLGLHICAQIVKAHNGQLQVTSTRKDGTRFTARLPLGTVSPKRGHGPARASASAK